MRQTTACRWVTTRPAHAPRGPPAPRTQTLIHINIKPYACPGNANRRPGDRAPGARGASPLARGRARGWPLLSGRTRLGRGPRPRGGPTSTPSKGAATNPLPRDRPSPSVHRAHCRPPLRLRARGDVYNLVQLRRRAWMGRTTREGPGPDGATAARVWEGRGLVLLRGLLEGLGLRCAGFLNSRRGSARRAAASACRGGCSQRTLAERRHPLARRVRDRARISRGAGLPASPARAPTAPLARAARRRRRRVRPRGCKCAIGCALAT